MHKAQSAHGRKGKYIDRFSDDQRTRDKGLEKHILLRKQLYRSKRFLCIVLFGAYLAQTNAGLA